MAVNDTKKLEKTAEADKYLEGLKLNMTDVRKLTAETRRTLTAFMIREPRDETAHKDLVETVSLALENTLFEDERSVGSKTFASTLRNIGCKRPAAKSTLEAMCDSLETI